MYQPRYSRQFKADRKKLATSGRYDIGKLNSVLKDLTDERPLPPERRDHPFAGDYSDCRDCHREGDWELIYRIEDEQITFVRTGTHSELF